MKKAAQLTICTALYLLPAAAIWADELGTNATAPISITVRKTPFTESTPVGPYSQPDWTTERRFPTTRVYLQQTPWDLGFEQWIRSKYFDGERGEHQLSEEFELGLPHRFQLDLYETWLINNQGSTVQDEASVELRYALADWGKIPMNPTLYYEYAFAHDDANVGEAKLLLGDELAHGWHWGANLSYEWRFGGDRSKEYMGTASLSKTIIDRKLSIGVEGLYASESVKDERHDPDNSLELGPSLQWRPTARTHVDLVPLFGLTDDAPNLESFVIFGYDFGTGKSKAEANAPVSMRH